MSTYVNLRGYNNQDTKNVVPYQTFPASFINTGQVWYGADNNFYIQKQTATVNSWSIGNNPPATSPSNSFSSGACGTQTAALGYGKILSPAPGFNPTAASILAESYDGTNWTGIANLNTIRSGGASSTAGSQTATVVFGGFLNNPPAPPSAIRSNTISKWDGSSWTAGNNMPFFRSGLGGSGTSTAALAFGGIQNPTAPAPTRPTGTAAKYDGTNWTNVNNMATTPLGTSGFSGLVGTGTQTATIGWAGGPQIGGDMQVYDGTNWTNIPRLTAQRRNGGLAGTSTAGVAFAGIQGQPESGVGRQTEVWNGTTWTTLLDRNVGTSSCPGVGSSTSALSAAGTFSPQAPPSISTTEEWSTNLFSSKLTTS